MAIPLLKQLHQSGELAEFERWLGLLNYVKVPAHLEFYINYYVLLYKVRVCESAVEAG